MTFGTLLHGAMKRVKSGLWGAVAAVALCVPTGHAAETGGAIDLQVKTLSNRADLISDGDALAEIIVPVGANLADLRVTLNGDDVTNAFAKRADGRVKGLLVGLSNGPNTVIATLPGELGAELRITNATRNGPVFSGPFPTSRYYCATPTPQPAQGDAPATNASGLSTQPDAACNAATEFKLYYKTTTPDCSLALPDPSPAMTPTAMTPPPAPKLPANPCFKPYDPTQTKPADLALTTTDAGLTVPYVVRVERGVINRGIYDIAVLFDPTKPWTAVAPQPQWNRKVFYRLGGGTNDPHRQFRPASPWTFDLALGKGFAVVVNSMSDSGFNSNRVLSAETIMMMKEHIGDSYGEILYTHATGCSGGAIVAHTAASLVPNLLDGVTITCSLLDETVTMEKDDCILLVEAYRKQPWLDLMARGKRGGPYSQAEINAFEAAINGHRDQTACQGWFNVVSLPGGNSDSGNYFPRAILPEDLATGRITQASLATNNCQLPLSIVYDPVTNPKGERCSQTAWAASIFGKAADGVHDRESRDNVGVQYGLKALLAGQISAEAFITINEIVGGFDADSKLVPSRTVADTRALATIYQTGLVVTGASLATYAEIDLRPYDDSLTDIMPGARTMGAHPVWRSYSLQDRLDRDVRGHGSHVMWRFGRAGLTPPPQLPEEALTVMDAWLTAIKQDGSTDPIEAKVLKAKPSAAVDYCLLSSDVTQSVKVTDQSVCDRDPYLKAAWSPRQVAGGPRTEDIMKCQLKPLEKSDYGGRLSASQIGRLRKVFSTGVCDWNRAGVEQKPPMTTPVTFNNGPGGALLGSPPISIAR